MKKVALHNLGCKVNAYEMEVMQQILTKNGYEIVPFADVADIYIVNTCSVTNIADRKSRQMLHKAKKQNPAAIVVAMGCYAQTDTEGANEDEAVDLIIGNNRKKDLIQILEEYEQDHDKTLHDQTVLDIATEQEYEETQLESTAEHTRAYIKVQDGCNQFCSYCIIPYARGRVRSREKEHVIQEIEHLASLGYKEVVLTGIHLSSYGIDFPEGKPQLLELIRAVHQIQGIERIRLGSLEPRIITEEFAKALSELEKICPHFHLSLQSGCDETLKRMNRRYDTSEYYEKTELLRKYFKQPALTTDVIVGFPGETEKEFETTRKFLNQIHFYEIHVFKYSRRKGTRADQMADQVPEPIKQKRSAVLIAESAKEAVEYRKAFLEQPVEVLFEESQEIEGQTYQVGHTREYVKIACRTEQDLTNHIIKGTPSRMITDEILELYADIR